MIQSGPFDLLSIALAQDYFVDSRYGSNDSSGISSNKAWKTIAKANGILKAGDTVFIKAGTYAETIRPSNSGLPGQYITYTRYMNDNVIIGGNIQDGANLSNRKWIKIDGLLFTDTNHYWIEFEPSGSNNYISNNAFKAVSSSMGYEGLHIRDGANYNIIKNNSFSSECRPLDLIQIWNSSYNLLEGNYIGNASHTALSLQARGTTEYNVIRGNTIQNRRHNNLALFDGANFTLVEGNKILDSGDDCFLDSCPQNKCGSDRDQASDRSRHSAIQVASENCIIRNNVLANNGRFTLESFEGGKRSVNNSVYNNTFYGNYIGWRSTTSQDNPLNGNSVLNNIFSNNIDVNMYFSASIDSTTNIFKGNNFSGSSSIEYKTAVGVASIENKYPEWSNNRAYNNNFVNADSKNFKLQGTSDLIDKGEWLTKITSASGSGNIIKVEDAKYFTDGFGIIDSDSVQIQGNTEAAKIVEIDYEANLIKLDRNVSWKMGAGLSLPYVGDGPDIGAFEYGAADAMYAQDTSDSIKPPKLKILYLKPF